MTNNEKINIILESAQESRPNTWRFGQAVFNFSLEVFPNEVEQLRGNSFDCFHRDEEVALFIDALKNILEENDIK